METDELKKVILSTVKELNLQFVNNDKQAENATISLAHKGQHFWALFALVRLTGKIPELNYEHEYLANEAKKILGNSKVDLMQFVLEDLT